MAFKVQSSDPAKTTEEWPRLRNRFVIDLNKNIIDIQGYNTMYLGVPSCLLSAASVTGGIF